MEHKEPFKNRLNIPELIEAAISNIDYKNLIEDKIIDKYKEQGFLNLGFRKVDLKTTYQMRTALLPITREEISDNIVGVLYNIFLIAIVNSDKLLKKILEFPEDVFMITICIDGDDFGGYSVNYEYEFKNSINDLPRLTGRVREEGEQVLLSYEDGNWDNFKPIIDGRVLTIRER